MEDFTVHDLRHHYGVTMARAGVPLGVLSRLMGHASISTTMKYADFHPEYRDVAPYMEAVDEQYRARPKLRVVAGGGA